MDNADDSHNSNALLHATSTQEVSGDGSGLTENDATVLTQTAALKTEEFPAGLTPRELAHALQGQMLDQFQLQQFIGGGGMGVVFKALDTTLHRMVAVKVVASHSISNEDLQRRFLIEAQSTARLDHPNIARIHFVGRDRGLPYIVFEYIDGVNLRDLVLNHGPLPVGDALNYTYQIAHALAHAWQRGVVHRDIKPSNILVTREGQAKLVDMGLARFQQVGAAQEDLTSTGVTLGTFDYISPEQARDPRVADTRSDIYSLGCAVFYMLAGRPPFAQGTPVQKLLQHQEDRPPNLMDLRSDIPEVVSDLVQEMLAKSPDDRPQTPVELVASLAHILQELGLQLPSALAPLPITVRSQRLAVWRRHAPWIIPVAALVAIIAWLSSRGLDATNAVQFPKLRSIEDSTSSGQQDAKDSTPVPPEQASRTLKDSLKRLDSAVSGKATQDDTMIDVERLFDGIGAGPVAEPLETDANKNAKPPPLSDAKEPVESPSPVETDKDGAPARE